MSSIKPLVQQECGQPNALVQFSNQIFSKPSTSAKLPSRENEFAQEYLASYNANTAAPTTFNMQNMLREINRPSILQQNLTKPPSSSVWADEFLRSSESAAAAPQNQFHAAAGQDWAAEFSLEQNFNTAWGQTTNQLPPQQNLKWSVEYLTESENLRPDFERSWNDEFMNFVQKVDNGEITLPESGTVNEQIPQVDDYWNQLEDQWDTMAKHNVDSQWLTEYNDVTNMYKDYQLQDNNPYADIDDPLTEGKRLLTAGELSSAILCFEASVKKMPENAEAWQFLGVAQAENEQEPKTIAALQKCLELEPKNLTALQSLAIAYTNESLYDAACRTLARWLSANEQYSNLAPNIDLAKYRPSSFVDRELFKCVEDAFLQATQRSSQVDPDLQNVFGVLYNLSGDLERAIDCFQVALMVKPNDARLWNRLGATLANNSRSADAVSAYRKALELYPAFVRARYNLGISCLNLGSHWQAVEHFVSALSLQNNGVGPSGKADMSHGIWGTLRVAAMGLKSDEFLNMIDARDFDAIRNFLSGRSDYSSVLPP